ncbi:sugar phosphate isomerase/epimerase family protein [Actinophytocola algeriensis]|uniref:Sugar phosphate isomerase/epimerase n=1 Tax=Actinophytocola algeriensis TaxID=1768010 RepID=A0A7W7PZL1_9PSEU|nr:sugar phosphate isomerase/epimerase [Actinophytocola algeriensis]MBB4904236.1 sugar phosphate isomerase/epimerase [Actinophytocola algeriensis]MBE1476906.1 sugar phosphate isomerase/epimerase [Actinophytocola algeriensis]
MRPFSFNQATAKYWPLVDVVKGCEAAGVRYVGLWREPVEEYGLARSAQLVRDAGLTVTSLCRGGFFGADDWFDDNRRALDECAELGAPALVLVCGGLFGRPLVEARARVAAGLEALAPHALDVGVTLAVEPMHPMFAADRSVVASLAGALELCAPFPAAAVGITLDTYHVWWDEQVLPLIEANGDRIASFQLADWVVPLPADVLVGRGLPGTGHVDFAPLVKAVLAAGYDRPIEVEVFNEELWQRRGEDVLRDTIAAYESVMGMASSTG